MKTDLRQGTILAEYLTKWMTR